MIPFMRIAAGMVLAATVAAQQPAQPKAMPSAGTVHGVYVEGHRLVINDTAFDYGPGLRVHDINGASRIGPAALKPGAIVSYTVEDGVVQEIWVHKSFEDIELDEPLTED